ncbi:murein biosynthesis integral membrane protein MurJ [Actinomadura barringtoniae]|uniref:Murein biosynthesis integral membrane protein MurJ n=1 Tax=Actinomadura barringtoniae TaxID=1427535 RepID=A0A939PJC9_9ACTN|nr:murein biosynthesis integral membrane protein MurJ [Actinomadura barringtoniae]MBO2453972.1 murein biosynthesis integral membrane protein MurJ [Actinomadura barringtoniae]
MPEVIEVAERAEPSLDPEPGLVPVHDPTELAGPGTADRPGSEGDEIGTAAQRPPAEQRPTGLARSSAVMAVGTVFSRVTGFMRTAVIGAALGTALLGDAYQAAEMIPYTVYELLLGGMLASVFVPFLVRRRKIDTDGGAATEQRLVTAVLLALVVFTIVGVLAAPWLISLYAGGYTGRQRDVTILLTRLLLLQIFFIGMSGLAGTMLNIRSRFGAPMWAPVANNLITMAAALMFLWIAGTGRTAETVTDAQLTLMGLGSAFGTVIQGVILAWTLRRAGFRWRPRLDLRGAGFGEAVRTAGWMMLYVVVVQIGVLVTANVATRAGDRAAQDAGHQVEGSGLAVYKFALVVFQLPYAVIAVSVITALLPRMSAHVADGRRDLVRADFSRGLRLASTLLVPLSLGLLVFGVPGAVLVFAHGSTSFDGARRIGILLMVFALMVIPFTFHQLLMRVFYALGDTRTPGLIAIPAGVVQSVTAFVLLAFVSARQVVVGLPLAYGLFYVVGGLCAAVVLRRRLGGMDARRILRTLLVLHIAAIPGVVFAAAVVFGFGHMHEERLSAVLALTIGGLGGGLLYVVFARFMKIPELGYFFDLARARLRR